MMSTCRAMPVVEDAHVCVKGKGHPGGHVCVCGHAWTDPPWDETDRSGVLATRG